ncbi:MAG: hypothetical protein Q7K71_02975 [Candidatus Omnitrophota bacterium]|nr:hypothetical protein [Candidatus Omnitrophota bacterium]
MKKAVLFILLFFVVGCATTQLSNSQRRSIEAKELEGSFDNAFKATLQVLQDKGYVITHTDYKAGVIKGETGWKRTNMFVTDKKQEASVTIEEWVENRVKERITFMLRENEGLGLERSRIIEDQKFLQEIYDEIQKEIFVRQNLNK